MHRDLIRRVKRIEDVSRSWTQRSHDSPILRDGDEY